MPPRALPLALLVEDDPSISAIMTEVLEHARYEVAAFGNGVGALEWLRSRPNDLPDVAIIDLLLPGMNGRELATRMKSDPLLARIPIVIATASRETPRDWLVLCKPFTI